MAQKKAPNKEAKPPENKGGLTINEGKPENQGAMVVPGKRLFLNAARDRLVEPGDPDAAFLYCTATDEVRRDQYETLIAGK